MSVGAKFEMLCPRCRKRVWFHRQGETDTFRHDCEYGPIEATISPIGEGTA